MGVGGRPQAGPRLRALEPTQTIYVQSVFLCPISLAPFLL
jgi:hypothetical protein